MTQTFSQALIGTWMKHKRYCRQEFQRLDLSEGQPKILLQLERTDGILQKDLSAGCGVVPATLTVILGNMLEQGLVSRVPTHVSGGKRGYLVYLTEKGRKMAFQVKEILSQSEKICLEDFTEEERELLLSFLARISNNLSQTDS